VIGKVIVREVVAGEMIPVDAVARKSMRAKSVPGKSMRAKSVTHVDRTVTSKATLVARIAIVLFMGGSQ